MNSPFKADTVSEYERDSFYQNRKLFFLFVSVSNVTPWTSSRYIIKMLFMICSIYLCSYIHASMNINIIIFLKILNVQFL